MTRFRTWTWLYAASIFTSAALLFLVQPMVGKMLLPLFGGAPAVWITCLVFYQTALLAGYFYAHVARRLGVRAQVLVHALLLAACLLFLPLDVGRDATPGPEASPARELLLRLLAGVGLPFVALSGTGTLLQAWFARTDDPRAGDPYFLYAASNLGSVLALMSYPFLIEPRMGLARQALLWTAGFAVLITLTVAAARAAISRPRPTAPPGQSIEASVSALDRSKWIFFSFIPTSLMMGVTLHLTVDIAPVPLLWIVPLTLYLLAFSFAFAGVQQLVRPLVWTAAPTALLLVYVVFSEADFPIWTEIALHLLALFLLSVAYLSGLAASRPHATRLTEFYLLVSLGGALAGIFNALLAPLLFRVLVEYRIVLSAGTALLPLVLPFSRIPFRFLARGPTPTPDGLRAVRKRLVLEPALAAAFVLLTVWTAGASEWPLIVAVAAPTALLIFKRSVAFSVSVTALAAFYSYGNPLGRHVIYRDRSFFSVLWVREDTDANCRTLVNGTTTHGRQSLREESRRDPQQFYCRASPVGQLIAELKQTGPLVELGIVGLGTGTLSAYGAPGDRFTFFEIDPAVARVASNPELFTYVRDSRADVRIVLGDARLSLQREPQGRFRALLVDAFSSDAIPVHLLTSEAMRLFMDKLRPDGILAFHVSNRYLDLAPLLGRAAREAALAARLQSWTGSDACGGVSSDWVIMSRDVKHFGSLARSLAWEPIEVTDRTPLWTDDFSNLLSVVKFSGSD